MNVAEIRAFFPGLKDVIYLNTATMAVGCEPARQAYERAVRLWSEGKFDWKEGEQAGEEVRAGFARLIGAQAEEIALVPAVSSAAGIVAANMPAAGRGESVVVGEGEFSSNYYPWLLLRERGYEIRRVPSVAGAFPAESYGALADAGTRLIAASAVQSASGYRADLDALSRVAARSGAWLFVDACQAAGAVPVNVGDGADFLAAASHKFLLGSRGMGYLYVRRALLDRIRPVLPGWKAARKPGESFYGPAMDLSSTASKLDTSLAWFAALAEQATLGMFRRFGMEAIFERNAHLSERLHEALAARFPDAWFFPPAHRSTIVSVPVPDAAAAMERLRAAGVVASARAGRVRLSLHFYNLEEEIDRVVDLLAPG